MLLGPGGGPRLRADEDGCIDGNAGEGAPMDNEATDCDVFCFLRDAETVGLGAGSREGWAVLGMPGCSPFVFLHSLASQSITLSR